MIVYAVFKEAVYRHECGGIFTSLERAIEAAQMQHAGERDIHHDYDVVPFDLDASTEQTSLSSYIGWEPRKGVRAPRGGELLEAPPVWSTDAKRIGVKR